MKKNKPLVKDKERIILQYIHSEGGGVSANEIATATGISYITVNKYLKKLVTEGILEEKDAKEKG